MGQSHVGGSSYVMKGEVLSWGEMAGEQPVADSNLGLSLSMLWACRDKGRMKPFSRCPVHKLSEAVKKG